MLRRTAILVLTALLLATPLSVDANRASIDKEQAAELALQRYPGRVLNVKTESQHYRVRVLQHDGRVVTLLVDRRTGRITKDDR
ncbi:MAG: hypothetical protein LAT66_09225 [Alkalimonas sp.]|nr:hypothetical protein [Alkalimonas sp.]